MSDSTSPLSVIEPPATLVEEPVTLANPDTGFYTDGGYLAQNPTWHEEDSPWKAEQILRMIHRNQLEPRTVCEIGCGAGEILVQLKRQLADNAEFRGYDISPQAHALASQREDERLHFRLGNLIDEPHESFDLILIVDLLEHLEDYLGFLRKLRPRAGHTIFHIPLDLSAYTVLRGHPILDLRSSVGHIHYFTRDTALAALRDTGYEVLDWFYSPDDKPLREMPLKQKMLASLRRGLFKLSPDFAVRMLGGRSLMVLAR